MHILYVDGSGSAGNPAEKHFILSGISVFERGIYHLIKAADHFVADIEHFDEDAELHANQIYAGRGTPWKHLDRSQREAILSGVVNLIASQRKSVTLFSIVVEKEALQAGQSAITFAFEEICNRFNMFLTQIYAMQRERQRGLVIMDEDKHERSLQSLAQEFRVNGTRWGKLRNLAEVPVFADSKASRLLQLADIVAYATWRKYEHKDGRFFDPLIDKFHQDNGILHGIVHRSRNHRSCYCPGCVTRRGK